MSEKNRSETFARFFKELQSDLRSSLTSLSLKDNKWCNWLKEEYFECFLSADVSSASLGRDEVDGR